MGKDDGEKYAGKDVEEDDGEKYARKDVKKMFLMKSG